MLYVDVNAMDVETEADSNDVTECPHDDQQSSGMFVCRCECYGR